MREGDVRERAFAMTLTNPAYPPGRYRGFKPDAAAGLKPGRNHIRLRWVG